MSQDLAKRDMKNYSMLRKYLLYLTYMHSEGWHRYVSFTAHLTFFSWLRVETAMSLFVTWEVTRSGILLTALGTCILCLIIIRQNHCSQIGCVHFSLWTSITHKKCLISVSDRATWSNTWGVIILYVNTWVIIILILNCFVCFYAIARRWRMCLQSIIGLWQNNCYVSIGLLYMILAIHLLMVMVTGRGRRTWWLRGRRKECGWCT